MIKVVLDTNTLISALGWKGKPNQVFDKIVKREAELVISDKQFSELSKALNYHKFQFTEEQKDRLHQKLFKYPNG